MEEGEPGDMLLIDGRGTKKLEKSESPVVYPPMDSQSRQPKQAHPSLTGRSL